MAPRYGKRCQSCSPRRPDFQVIGVVSSAEEALAGAESERIDAAVVDDRLGDHDAREARAETRFQFRTGHHERRAVAGCVRERPRGDGAQ